MKMLLNEDKDKSKYERNHSSGLCVPAEFESQWNVGVLPLLKGKIFLINTIML